MFYMHYAQDKLFVELLQVTESVTVRMSHNTAFQVLTRDSCCMSLSSLFSLFLSACQILSNKGKMPKKKILKKICKDVLVSQFLF